MNPMDMMATMSKMMGGMDMSAMNPMMAMMSSMMNKPPAGGGMDMSSMNPMMAMMAGMNKDLGGMDMSSMNPMMAMMANMSKTPSGGTDMNPMAMMMSMMSGGGMPGGMPGGMDPAMNPMMAAMGGVPGMSGPPICQFYAKSGWCKYGDECMLKHIGPSKPPPDLQSLGEYYGVIKSYNPDKGFGFIACDALREEHK